MGKNRRWRWRWRRGGWKDGKMEEGRKGEGEGDEKGRRGDNNAERERDMEWERGAYYPRCWARQDN
jgi:hypothetical protein